MVRARRWLGVLLVVVSFTTMRENSVMLSSRIWEIALCLTLSYGRSSSGSGLRGLVASAKSWWNRIPYLLSTCRIEDAHKDTQVMGL